MSDANHEVRGRHRHRLRPQRRRAAAGRRPRRVLRPEDVRPARQPDQPLHRLHLRPARARRQRGHPALLPRPGGRRPGRGDRGDQRPRGARRRGRGVRLRALVGCRAGSARRRARRAGGRDRGLRGAVYDPRDPGARRGPVGPDHGADSGRAPGGRGAVLDDRRRPGAGRDAPDDGELADVGGPAGADPHAPLRPCPGRRPGHPGGLPGEDHRAGARAGRREQPGLVPPHGGGDHRRHPRRAAGHARRPGPRRPARGDRAGADGFLSRCRFVRSRAAPGP